MKLFFNSLKVLGVIALSLTCNIIPLVLLQKQGEFSLPMKWGLGLLYIVFIVFVIFFLWKWHKQYEEPAVQSQKMKWKDWGIALLFFLGARVVAVVGTLLIQQLTGQSATANDQALQSFTAYFKGGFFLYTILYVVLVGIVGPIIEELAYRAFPDHLLFQHGHKVLSGVVTTAVFAFPHASTVPEFCLYALIGAILYLAYQRRGNIKDSMLVHILNNLPSALYFLFLGL